MSDGVRNGRIEFSGFNLRMAQFGYNVLDCDESIPNIMFRIDNLLDWEDASIACMKIPGGNLASIRTFSEYKSMIALVHGITAVRGASSYAHIGLDFAFKSIK